MFKCQNEFCGKQVEPRQPVNRIVTERRNVTYTKEIFKRDKPIDTIGIPGWEIVKEICVCPQCFTKLTGKQPKLVIQQQRPQARKARGFNEQPSRRKKWQNPKSKKQSRTSEKESSQVSKSPKRPLVEKVNPIPLIKE